MKDCDGSDGTGFCSAQGGVSHWDFSKIAGQVRQVSPGRSLNSGAQVESPVAPGAPGALTRFDNLAPKYNTAVGALVILITACVFL